MRKSYGCITGVSTTPENCKLLRAFVFFDFAVANADDALGVRGDVGRVRHEDDRGRWRPISFRSLTSCPRRFLRHVKRQATVRFLDTTERGTKATENACIFSYSLFTLETNTCGIAAWSLSF